MLRLPCAGGGRVLAAEPAMLRIACFIITTRDTLSGKISGGTELTAELFLK